MWRQINTNHRCATMETCVVKLLVIVDQSTWNFVDLAILVSSALCQLLLSKLSLMTRNVRKMRILYLRGSRELARGKK